MLNARNASYRFLVCFAGSRGSPRESPVQWKPPSMRRARGKKPPSADCTAVSNNNSLCSCVLWPALRVKQAFCWEGSLAQRFQSRNQNWNSESVISLVIVFLSTGAKWRRQNKKFGVSGSLNQYVAANVSKTRTCFFMFAFKGVILWSRSEYKDWKC